MSKPMFNQAQITEASEAIASALRPHIAHEYESTVDEAVAATQAYQNGLKIGETHLALIQALGILQQETLTKFSSLLYDKPDVDPDGVGKL